MKKGENTITADIRHQPMKHCFSPVKSVFSDGAKMMNSEAESDETLFFVFFKNSAFLHIFWKHGKNGVPGATPLKTVFFMIWASVKTVLASFFLFKKHKHPRNRLKQCFQENTSKTVFFTTCYSWPWNTKNTCFSRCAMYPGKQQKQCFDPRNRLKQ